MLYLKNNPYKASGLIVGQMQTVETGDSDQTQQNAASDQRLHCLLTENSI